MDLKAREAQLRRLETTLPSSNWASLVLAGQPIPQGFCKCRICLHLYPPIYLENSICYDCYLSNLKRYRMAMLPSSRSIIRGV